MFLNDLHKRVSDVVGHVESPRVCSLDVAVGSDDKYKKPTKSSQEKDT